MTISSPETANDPEVPDTQDDLATAFTPALSAASWATDDASPEAPDGLRALVPPPPSIDYDAFEDEVRRHRVLILRRGAVIAVSTILSIGGALFLHFLLGGVFLLGLFLGTGTTQVSPGVGSGGDSASEGGRGYMALDDSPLDEAPAAAGRPDALASFAPTESPAVPPPALPSLPETAVAAVDVRSLIPETPTPVLDVPKDFGTVTVKPPVRAPVPPPAEQVTALPPQAAPTPRPPGASAVALNNAANLGGLRGNFGERDDEELLRSDFKPGRGGGAGRGTGRGRGIGSGLDRGPSGADRPNPVLLDGSGPRGIEEPRIERPVTFEIEVLETGEIGRIQMLESSGRPEADEVYRYILSAYKFAPAIRAGKPIRAPFPISFAPKPQ